MNDLIAKHPMDGVRFTKPVRATDDISSSPVTSSVCFLKQRNAPATTISTH